MTVAYNQEDVNNVIAGNTVTPRIHYKTKTTNQFDGPNKANEEQVFTTTATTLQNGIVASDATIQEEKANNPKNEEIQRKKVKSAVKKDVLVPEPLPPAPPPPAAAPAPKNLDIDFKSSSDKLENESQVIKLVKPYAEYLKANTDATLILSGNSASSNAPAGNSKAVQDTPSAINGTQSTVGALQQARADAVKKILVEKYKINPNRIVAKPGANNPNGKTNVNAKIQTK